MKRSALVLVFLCLVNTHLCGRLHQILNHKEQTGKRLTPPRLTGINRLPPFSRRFVQDAFSYKHLKKVKDVAEHSGPSLVRGVAAAATAGAAVVGIGVGWDLDRFREEVRNARGTEGVPSLSEFGLSQKSEQHGSSPAPPAPPQEEEDSPSQSQHDDELPPPGKYDSIFSIATDSTQHTDFTYKGDFRFQEGQQSVVSRVVREDGTNVIMKRPRYTERDWEDNLQKECFVARYLNLVGSSNGVANCLGERTFEPLEVAALIASQKSLDNTLEHENKGKWHAILVEQVNGKSFMNTELSLARTGREDSDTQAAETKAVEQIIATTAQMLKAGIVNVDQWHNILVSDEGEAKFIDLEGANFLTDAPLQLFLSHVGKDFKHEQREMKVSEGSEPVGKWQVTEHPPPKVLNKDEAETKVKAMVRNIFGLVPTHAILAAEETLKSRERLGNFLDDVVDETWAAHKAAVHLQSMKDLVDKTQAKLEKLEKLQIKNNKDLVGETKAQIEKLQIKVEEHTEAQTGKTLANLEKLQLQIKNIEAEEHPEVQAGHQGETQAKIEKLQIKNIEAEEHPEVQTGHQGWTQAEEQQGWRLLDHGEKNIKAEQHPEAQEDYSTRLNRYESIASPTDQSTPAGVEEPRYKSQSLPRYKFSANPPDLSRPAGYEEPSL